MNKTVSAVFTASLSGFMLLFLGSLASVIPNLKDKQIVSQWGICYIVNDMIVQSCQQ